MMSSETLDVIARRFACRSFQSTPVPDDLIRAIGEAGLHSPSAMNRQPWHITVITDADLLAKINDVGLANMSQSNPSAYARIQDRGGRLLYGCPAMIIVSTEPNVGPFPVAMDAGIVAATITLAATSLGLATCIAAMPGVAFDGPLAQALRAAVIPDGYEFSVAVLVGYPAVTESQPHPTDQTKISFA